MSQAVRATSSAAPPASDEQRRPPVDPRLLRHAAAARRFLVLSVLLGVATAVTVIAQAHLLADVVARGFLGGADLAAVAGALVALTAVVTIRAALTWGSDVAAHHAAAGVRTQLRRRLLQRLATDGPVALLERSRGDLAVTATRGVEALDGYFARYLPQLVLAAVVPVIAIAWIWPRDRLSVLVLIITLPLIPVFMALIGMLANRRVARQWRTMQRLGGHFLEVLAGLPTLKTLGAADRQRDRVIEVTERFRASTMGTLRIAFLSAGWLELMAMIGTAMIAVGIGLRLVEGTLDLQTGLAVLILAPEIYLPVRAVGQQFHASMEGMEAAGDVLDVIDADLPAATPPTDGRPTTETPTAGTTTVRLQDVWLTFPGRERPALAGVGLDIRPGERLGLIGPTGAGKSSILTLLLGMATAEHGEVVVATDTTGSERPLATLDPDRWRAGIGWVPQRPHLVAGTIADNLRLGRPGATDEEVAEAARLAALDEFIADLPLGLHQPVGEDGTRLSGGQRRRIALARALLRRPSLLLLDEPTSDLDPITAARVIATLEGLPREVTVVVVTHATSLVQRLDRVAVIADGRVLSLGSPHDVGDVTQLDDGGHGGWAT